jgi:hypothetical protein
MRFQILFQKMHCGIVKLNGFASLPLYFADVSDKFIVTGYTLGQGIKCKRTFSEAILGATPLQC